LAAAWLEHAGWIAEARCDRAIGIAALFTPSQSARATITWKSGCEWFADSCFEISPDFCENSSGSCVGPPFCNNMQVCINYEQHVQAVTVVCHNDE
jgi:hypothetical protein